jgi:hypothetical protein
MSELTRALGRPTQYEGKILDNWMCVLATAVIKRRAETAAIVSNEQMVQAMD